MFGKSVVALCCSAPVVAVWWTPAGRDAITAKKVSRPKWNNPPNTLLGSGVKVCPE